MNTILDRLTDAMSAAASTVRDEELRPLTMPKRRRRLSPWAAPLAAAAAVVLVIGLAVSASNGLFGTRRFAGPAPSPLRATPLLSVDRPRHLEDRGPLNGHRQGHRRRSGADAGGRRDGLARAGLGWERDVLHRRVRARSTQRADLPVPAHRRRARDGVCPGNRRLAAPRVGRGCAGGIARRRAGRGRGLLLPLPRAVRAATIRPAHRDRHRHRGAEHVAGRVARPRVYLLPRRQPVLDRRAP